MLSCIHWISFVLINFCVANHCQLSSLVYSSGGGAAVENRLKTCTKLDPITTIRKNAINVLLTGKSSWWSAALPIDTLPRLVMFLSNFSFRFLTVRGFGCNENRKHRNKKQSIQQWKLSHNSHLLVHAQRKDKETDEKRILFTPGHTCISK